MSGAAHQAPSAYKPGGATVRATWSKDGSENGAYPLKMAISIGKYDASQMELEYPIFRQSRMANYGLVGNHSVFDIGVACSSSICGTKQPFQIPDSQKGLEGTLSFGMLLRYVDILDFPMKEIG